jgi:hypothetical protein
MSNLWGAVWLVGIITFGVGALWSLAAGMADGEETVSRWSVPLAFVGAAVIVIAIVHDIWLTL